VPADRPLVQTPVVAGRAGHSLEVLLLGPVEVRAGGHPLPLGSARQRAVLARLALQPGEVVSVESLVDALWDEEPPGNAKGNLQSYVSRLRRLMGEGAIRFEHGGYRLDVDADAVDATRALSLAGSARTFRRSGALTEALDAYRRSLALWRGPSLLGLSDQLGFGPDAVRLDNLRDDLIDELNEVRIDAGEATDALTDIRHRAEVHALRERTQLLLVRALHSAGESAEALRAADAFRRRLVEATGLDPGAELSGLERAVLAGEASVPSTATGTVVDRPAAHPRRLGGGGRLFGRERDLAAVAQSVAEERLVTVTGPGGVGKTRLVGETVQRLDGDTTVLVVELDAVPPGEVAQAVASSVGADTGVDVEALADYLVVRRAVLVLDNCEHVIDEVRRLVVVLLSAEGVSGGGVTVLATSRIRLGIPGERVVTVAPLDASDSDSPAVQMLLHRTADPGLDGRRTDPGALVELCQRLDGIPLALELAAARASSIGVDGVLAHLADGLDTISAPAGSTRERHGTLRRVVEWSFGCLGDDARRLADACAWFEGGFPLDAAVAMGAVTSAPVVPVVAELVDSSLLLVDGTAGRRYRMLETVRALGREHLRDEGLAETVAATHAEWVCGMLAEQCARAGGPEELDALESLSAERGNIRAALRWAVDADDRELAGRLAGPLAGLVLYRPDGETLSWLRRLASIEGLEGTDHDVVVCAAAARAAYLQGDLSACRSLVDRANASAGGDAGDVARHSLAVWHLYRGDHDEAADVWWRTAGRDGAAPTDRMNALGGIALARAYAGDVEAATEAAGRLSELAAAIEQPTSNSWQHYVWGEIALRRDGPTAGSARRHLEVATDLATSVGADFITGVAGTALLSLLVRSDDREAVARHAPRLLEMWLRTATLPQLWTCMRLVAEHLASEHPTLAELLLDAADRDPAAPVVVGEDARRHAAVRAAAGAAGERSLGHVEWTGSPTASTISAASPRATLVGHVIAVLRQEADG
jgi:predicted ATPase/DNA-binding SARP family transcriptional activator